MAASAATANSSSGLCPSYAVICSFLERYGALLDLPELTFPQLERYLQDTSSVPKLLVDLHIKLLRKIGKSVSADRWEKYLVKVCQELNSTWAWELEQNGYTALTVECKTGILKYLCECQFDENVKFKTTINEEDPDKMRLQPIGRDKDGQMYWFQLDQDNNVRVYVEEQDDLDGSTWKCIVRDRNDLAEVLAVLKTQIDPELFKKKESEQESKPDEGEDKENAEEGGVKKPEVTTDEEEKHSKEAACSVSPKTETNEEVAQKGELKLEVTEAKSPQNGVVESKVEPEAPLLSENKIISNSQTIKEEPMEVSNSKSSAAAGESAPAVHSGCALVKAEQEEEAKRSSAEEQQQKNDQQAKIPLKKRGMKFSEDFDKNSSGTIMVQKASVSQVREPPKGDMTSGEMTKAKSLNDHVNGDAQHTSEKVISSNLCESYKETEKQRKSAESKEHMTEPGTGDSTSEARGKEVQSTDQIGIKNKVDGVCGDEKTVDEVASRQGDSEKKNQDVQIEKESTMATDGKEAHASESSSLQTTESRPSSQDGNNALNKSPNHEEPETKTGSEQIDPKAPCTAEKTTTLKEKDKTLMINESEKLNSNHKIMSKEVKSKDSEKCEGKQGSADMDATESSHTQETLKSEVRENVTDLKHTETINAKETETPEANADNFTLKEMPGVTKTTEMLSVDRDSADKANDSENVSSSVIKKTEILKQSDDTESPADTQKSTVIKKADKPLINEKSEGKLNHEETVRSSVIKMVEEPESREPTEKCDDVKDAEMSPATDKNIAPSSETSEETETPEKSVCCKDSKPDDAAKISNSTVMPAEVEEVAAKDDLTKPQEGDNIEINLVAQKKSEEAAKEKHKSPSPVEKINVSEEAVKISEKSKAKQETVIEEQPDKSEPKCPTSSHPSSENEKLTNKENENDTDKEKLLNVSEKHSCQDKESKGDSTENELSPTEGSKGKPLPKDGENSTKTEKPARQNANQEDCESSAETDRQSDPSESKKPDADRPVDEQSKGETEEDACTTKAELVDGGDAPSDVQTEAFRQKIKASVHRRKAELLQEERRDSESDSHTGRSLRRSPRISRPTQKAVEIQDRKLEKPKAPVQDEKCEDDKGEKEKDEEDKKDEEEEVKAVQKKPKEKKADQEGQTTPKGRKRRKVRWSRTHRKKKSSEDDDDNSEDESSEEEESEEEDDSDEDYKVERSRNRRNRNRERRNSDSSTSDDDLPPNDDPCKHCGLPNHPELILLCDSCDNGYHTACLRPPLMIIPDGEWFCPPCQHKQLCDKLEEQLQNLDAELKKRERAERRKERLIYVGISVENIITPSVSPVEGEEEKPETVIKEKKETKKSKNYGRRSTRAKKTISYRFDEFDEAIEEAIEEDIKEAEGGGAGRGKDMANITGQRGKDMSTILQAGEEGKENGHPPRSNSGQRRKKRRRLNDLDSDSTVDEEESEEEFHLSESSEEFIASDNETGAETDADSNNSDFGSTASSWHRTSSRRKKPSTQRQSSRKRRRPRGYSDDEEEETDEEDDEEEIVTEGSSEFSDSDLDMSRRRSRRRLKKQVNYCETSESDGSQAEANRNKMKPRRRLDSSDSEASFSRSEEDSGDRRTKRRGDSSEEDSQQRRRRLALKRRRASEADDSDDDSDESSEEDRPIRKRVDDSDDDSDESSEEDRPIRKRVNRIDSDDDEEEEEEKQKEKTEKEKEKAEEGGTPTTGTNTLDDNLVELPPTNGQNPMKNLEGFVSRPDHPDTAKNTSATPAAAIAPNGLATQEMAPQDDEEDDLLGVTDLVDYVCNNEQL
ncbi:hypothetical protein LDENG_00127540 [Lucifuga dentata]|nr:hypothetical protein LDENG_00127540 [Lucifuga dentata]